MDTIYIDIINFIFAFLLIDFINGAHNNFIAKKVKSGALTICIMLFISFALSVATSFILITKIALSIIILLTFLGIVFFKSHIKQLAKYKNSECGKEDFFSKQKIMVLVPHEDDDINLLGGVMEQYVKYGSEVYVVFATNGDGDKRFDMSKMGYIRMHEAIKALEVLGIPEKNIIFLGYGDGWGEGKHIYNAKPEEVVISTAGKSATYGLENHKAYSDGKDYTYSNYFDDIKQVVIDVRPDVIYCIDYDSHNDHRAVSMLFEKAMGEILKTTSYRPIVYKGFGYRTAWSSTDDFDLINIKSTVNSVSANDVELYDWNKRVCIPVDTNSINRKVEDSKLYQALSLYASQKANESAKRIINGDKVFWQRRTDSLLYDADISVSSGNKDKLTDFMLLDCDDLIEHGKSPYDSVWHPDDNDDGKSICVNLGKQRYISFIALFDNPSPVDNILNVIITLDDGTMIETGELNSYGDATIVQINKKIAYFTVKIDKYEGENFGLCELEAYSEGTQYTPQIFKFIDDENNFVYDYIVPLDGEQILRVYSNHNVSFDKEKFVLCCDNKKCSIELKNDKIIATCPAGQKCQIELLSQDNKVLDKIVLRNPRKAERYYLSKCIKQTKNYSYIKRGWDMIKRKIH